MEKHETVDAIMAYESGELSPGDTIELFAHLVKTGLAWSLQGSYGRSAAALIQAGCIAVNGTITDSGKDLYA